MASILRNKKGGGLSLVFDVRSSSVGGSIIDLSGEAPTILYTTRIFKYFEEIQDSVSFVSALSKTFDQVISDISSVGIPKIKLSDNPKKIEMAYVIYSSPWYVSHMKELKFRKDKPFRFTEDQFRKIIKEELSRDKELEESVTIEKDITHVRVNGYVLNNPFDKKTKDLDIAFYISSVGKKTVKDFEEKIHNSFGGIKQIRHRTHPLILFSTIRDMFTATNNFLSIDIGGEMTDIGMVRDDSLLKILNMPLGKNYFIRKIMETCGLDYMNTLSVIRTISKEEIHNECNNKMKKILPELEKEWAVSLNESISNFYDKEIPNTIFVSVDRDVKDLFTKILSGDNFKFGDNLKPNVILVDHNIFKDIVNINPGVVDDAFMELITTFLYNNQK